MPQVFQSEFQKSYSLSFVDLWFPAIISVMFTICVQSAGADLLFPLLYIEKKYITRVYFAVTIPPAFCGRIATRLKNSPHTSPSASITFICSWCMVAKERYNRQKTKSKGNTNTSNAAPVASVDSRVIFVFYILY